MADITELEQNLTDIEGLVDQVVAVIVAGDALAVTLRAEIAALIAAANIAASEKAALASKIDSAFAKSVSAEDKLRAAVPLVPPVGGTPLAVTHADRAAFDAAVAAYTGPEGVTLDGSEVKAGTTPPLDFFTHSDSTPPGVIDMSGPTS